MNSHCDERMLQEYVDCRLEEIQSGLVRSHLGVCPDCAARHRALMSVDAALRRMPLERASRDMTDIVLARIVHTQGASIVDRMLEPRFLTGAVFVLFGVVGAVGALVTTQAGSGTGVPSRWQGILDGALRDTGGFVETGSALLTRLAPQLFSAGALNVTLTLVLLVPLFVFADRMLAKRRVPG